MLELFYGVYPSLNGAITGISAHMECARRNASASLNGAEIANGKSGYDRDKSRYDRDSKGGTAGTGHGVRVAASLVLSLPWRDDRLRRMADLDCELAHLVRPRRARGRPVQRRDDGDVPRLLEIHIPARSPAGRPVGTGRRLHHRDPPGTGISHRAHR